MNKSIAVIIHARLQSTRCPKKHTRDLGDGNNLIKIAVNNVSKLKNIDEKYLAAYEPELKEVAEGKIHILHREYDSVAPGNPPHSIFYRHLENVKSDFIVNYNPCQPFLDVDKLQEVIDWFKSSDNTSLITVKKERNFYWNDFLAPVNFKPGDRLSTIAGPWLFSATHSLVIYERKYMLDNWQLFPNLSNEPYPYVVDWPEEELVDVDTELDFKLVKTMYNEIRS